MMTGSCDSARSCCNSCMPSSPCSRRSSSTRSTTWARNAPISSAPLAAADTRSEEHTSELQSQSNLVCRLLLEKKNNVARDVGLEHPELARHPGRHVRHPLYA